MESLKLCTKTTTSRIVNNTPERVELSLCLENTIKPELGWFLSPQELKDKTQRLITNIHTDVIFSKNHAPLIEMLRKEFHPHKIHKLELSYQQQKRVYEA